jgi:NAD+ synthase (glutamine-hydrolysing)
MLANVKVALCQIDTTVGDFAGNVAKVREAARAAAAQGADVAAFPELTLCGYPPRDLLDVPEFVRAQRRALDDLAREGGWGDLGVVVGFVEPHDGEGAGLYNACALVDGRGGRVAAVGRKTLLPTYDVFDEGRYFDPAAEVTVAEFRGRRIGLSICEDVWNDKRFWSRRRYPRDPIEEMVKKGADFVLNISASPYAMKKPALRSRMLSASAQRHRTPIAYVNLVGGNDSLVFDGHSAAFDAEGCEVARASGFREETLLWETTARTTNETAAPTAEMAELWDALVMGVRDYARKTGFKGAVLGLSGGIDSSLTAAVAAEAFEPQNVLGVAMPSRYTAGMSTEDARALAERLGIRFEVVTIEPMFRAFMKELTPLFAGLAADVTEENIQPRIRMTILMALSNKMGKLLLSTGNKSELATGYCTLYGDMAGGLSVIGDLHKGTVYALSRWVNRDAERIPARVLTRPPTAELRPDQTDQDSLPPYDDLDRVLAAHVEDGKGAGELVEAGLDPALVKRVLGMLVRNEYKRRQAAPTLRVSPRAFGEGWRFPIAHKWRY